MKQKPKDEKRLNIRIPQNIDLTNSEIKFWSNQINPVMGMSRWIITLINNAIEQCKRAKMNG